MKVQLGSLITLHCGDAGVGHTFLSLNKSMCGPDFEATIVAPSCESDLRGKDFIEAVPKFLRRVCYRIPGAPRFITEKRFVGLLGQFDAVYLFPGCSPELLKAVASRKKPVFVERINCHNATVKQVLDEAYGRLGLKPEHNVTSATAAAENEQLDMIDFVFCPSLEVMNSYLAAGASATKLILSSYGWRPDRFPNRSIRKVRDPSKPCTFLFVGYLSVRKGTHLLLRAWEKAAINGRLVLYGNIEPAIEKTCGEILARPDVVRHKYTSDVGQAYGAADAFVFPSLEEGSPLVTYEAMAHGLPVLVSPMGSGGIVRNGIDGAVVSPYDEEGWIEALQKFSMDADLRRSFGDAAQERADEFTWDKVGRRRAHEIVKRINRNMDGSIAVGSGLGSLDTSSAENR
jgi:glycosyltransferase involved in cell wall biosynthesis